MSSRARKFTLELSNKLASELDQMAGSENISRAELMRRALSLLKVVLNERHDNQKLAVTDKDNKVIKEIVIT